MRNIFLPCPATGRSGREEGGSASVWMMGTGNGKKEQGWERSLGWVVAGTWTAGEPRSINRMCSIPGVRAALAASARCPELRWGCHAGGELVPIIPLERRW